MGKNEIGEFNKDELKDKKPTMRQLKAIETKKKIYNAGLEIINEKNFSELNIEDITNRADVSVGSFYTYFQSKEDLVKYMRFDSDEIYVKSFNKVKDEEFPQKLESFIRISYKMFSKRGKGILKAMISTYFSIPDYNFYQEDRPLINILREIIESAKGQGYLDETVDTKKYIMILLSSLSGAEVMWCFDEDGVKLDEFMVDTVMATAKGLKKRST